MAYCDRITSEDWRERSTISPVESIGLWGTLSKEERDETREELQRLLDKAASSSPIYLVKLAEHWNEHVCEEIGWERLRSIWHSADDWKPGAAYQSLRGMPESIGRRFTIEDRISAWNRFALVEPAEALREHSFFMGSQMSALLDPELLANSFRRAMQGSSPIGMWHYTKLPAAARAFFTDRELLEMWRKEGKEHPASALKILPGMPENFRAQVSGDEVDALWSFSLKGQSVPDVHKALRELPAVYRQHLKDESLAEMWTSLAVEADLVEMLGRWNSLPADLQLRIHPVGLKDAWLDFTRRGVKGALKTLTMLPQKVRDEVSTEELEGVWQKRFRQNPTEAIREWEMAPADVRSRLGRDTLMPLLASTNSKVRLAAISMVGKMPEKAASEVEARESEQNYSKSHSRSR